MFPDWRLIAYTLLARPAIIVLIQTLILIFGLPISYSVHNRPFASAKAVLEEYSNFSDWTPGVAVLYSSFCALWVNSSWMLPLYAAEETHNARKEIARSIVYTFWVTANSGLVICLVYAFCIIDIEAAATDRSYVFIPTI